MFHSSTCLAFISNANEGVLNSYLIKDDKISFHQTIPAADKLMPLALSADKKCLFAVARGDNPGILTYSIDYQAAALNQVRFTAITDNLVYIALSPVQHYLYGVSYETGQLVIIDLPALLRGDYVYKQVINDIPHAHCVVISPDERYVYVSSLSTDTLYTFRWRNGILASQATVPIVPGFGPRHMRLDPSSLNLYVISEFRGTVAVLNTRTDPARPVLEQISPRPYILSQLQDGIARPAATAALQPDPALLHNSCWASEILVSRDRRFIYIAERTSSRILVYCRDSGGEYHCRSWVGTETQPRSIQFTPDERYLVCCGEKSTQVSLYQLAPSSGELLLLDQAPGGNGANCIEIVGLGG